MQITRRNLALLALLAGPAAAQIQIPATPAGKAFQAWFTAFNDGSRTALTQFHKEWIAPGHRMTLEERVEMETGFREQTGGLELRKILSSSDFKITARMKEKNGGQWGEFEINVQSEAPHRITMLRGEQVDAPPEAGEKPKPPVARMREAELIPAAKAFIEELAGKDAFSGSVILGRHGKPLFQGAWGYRDRAEKAPNNIDTKFALGSMNKMFTAVAVLQLAQAGKVSLNEPIGKYLPDYPNREAAGTVTLHHLLTHTGGMGDIFGPEFSRNIDKLRDLKDYVALYGNRAPEFKPGERFSYSNYGMLLAGYVVERVSGMSYYDYCREKIFRPTGMKATDSYWKTEKVENLAQGYMKKKGSQEWTSNIETMPMRGTAAGGGFSTAPDLLRFADALLKHKLLDARHTDLLLAGKVDAGRTVKYAYGFMDATRDGLRRVGHGGGAPGMNGDLLIFPSTGYVVITLANLDPPAAQQVSNFISARIPGE